MVFEGLRGCAMSAAHGAQVTTQNSLGREFGPCRPGLDLQGSWEGLGAPKVPQPNVGILKVGLWRPSCQGATAWIVSE